MSNCVSACFECNCVTKLSTCNAFALKANVRKTMLSLYLDLGFYNITYIQLSWNSDHITLNFINEDKNKLRFVRSLSVNACVLILRRSDSEEGAHVTQSNTVACSMRRVSIFRTSIKYVMKKRLPGFKDFRFIFSFFDVRFCFFPIFHWKIYGVHCI